MVHLHGQALHPKREFRRELGFFGNIEHLELIQEPVHVADAVPAGITKLSLRMPALAERRDLDRGLLDHAPSTDGSSHASRAITLLSKLELVKNCTGREPD